MRALVWLLLVALPAAAADAAIGGRVVNALTGEAIRQAMVSMFCVPPAVTQTAITGADGVFKLQRPAGANCTLVARKPGFSETGQGPRYRPGASGEYVLKLDPAGAITGRVMGSDGEAVPGAAIYLIGLRTVAGRKQPKLLTSVDTDDRGSYRFAQLERGDYLVRAAGYAGGTRSVLAMSASAPPSNEAFVPVTSPIVHIDAGSEQRTDFTLTLAAGHTISGALQHYSPDQPVRIELRGLDDEPVANRVAFNAVSGHFYVRDVPRGSYILRASQTYGAAEETLQVSADVTGIALTMSGLGSVRGLLRWTGDDARGFATIEMRPASLVGVSRAVSATSRDGEAFQVPQLFPGRYRVEVHAVGYVSSITLGGQDITNQREIVMRAGMDSPPLEILMRSDTGRVEGKVKGSGRAQVVLSPTVLGQPPLLGACDPSGRFVIAEVPPGDYTLYGGENLIELEYSNPQALAGLRGERVRVEPKQTATVELQL